MSRKTIDLTGMKYGKLTAIEKIEVKSSKKYWKWKCECGNEKIIRADLVKGGYVKSCGCLWGKSKKKPLIILEGSKYGKLTVIKQAGRNKQNYIMYECKCECGNTVTVTGSRLHRGKAKSCGCISTEIIKKLQPVAKDTGRYLGTKIGIISSDKQNSNNTSGIKGVYYIKDRRKWRASIGFRGKTIYLGQFENKEDAIKARKEAEKIYFQPIIEEYKNRGVIK